MGIDSVGSTTRTEHVEPEPITSASRQAAIEANTTQRYDGTSAVGSAAVTDSGDFGHLLAGLFNGGKTSKEQANHFDFFTLLGKIFEAAGQALSGSPSSPSTTPKKTDTSKDTSKTDSSENSDPKTADDPKQLGSSDVNAMFSGATGPQDYDKGFKQGVHAQGSTTLGGATFSGQADASVYAGAGTKTTSYSGPDGAGVTVEADARIGVSASASGSIKSEFGEISGSVKATAEIYAHAKAYAQVNSKGATAGAEVEVGAHVKAEAQVDASAFGGLVSGHADANAEAGAGGKAGAKVGISYAPPSVAVDVDADAFAGARAAFDAKGGFAGVTYGVHGEAWAGVGAKVSVDAGISDGKFHFSFGAGISLGVGTFLKFDFEIDLKPIGKALGTFFSGLGKLFGGGAGDGSLASKAIGDAANRIQPGSSELTKKKPKADEASDAESTDEQQPDGVTTDPTETDPSSFPEDTAIA